MGMDIVTLLDWSRANGIRIHSNLRVLHNGEKGIHLRAASSPILPEQQSRKLPSVLLHTSPPLLTTERDIRSCFLYFTNRYVSAFLRRMSVVVIPKSAVLSARSCTLADHIPHAPYGHDATLTLALALYSEQLLASRSRWAGYLQSLPSRQNWDGIALFWDAALCDPLSSRDTDTDTDIDTDTNDDGRRTESGGLDPDGDAAEARRWLQVTEAETHFLLPGPHRTPLLPVSPLSPLVTCIIGRDFRFLPLRGGAPA